MVPEKFVEKDNSFVVAFRAFIIAYRAITNVIKKLFRIYTPFILAVCALINGILSIKGYDGLLYRIISEFTGHSFLVIAYFISTHKRMCKWYKYTNYLLFMIHIPNILYYNDIVYKNEIEVFYSAIVLSIFALLTFLIYRVSVGITKILC